MESKPSQLVLFKPKEQKRVLVFDVWGDLGHFKKPYTTTSPLSFAFPPRPTITGIISAMIGMGKDQYADLFLKKDADIGIRLLKPVKKMRISQNLIHTKKAVLFSRIKIRTQIRIEYVKDPKYRIYFCHKDGKIYNRLKEMLEKHESVYTVSLGLSELLANFQYVGEAGCCKKANSREFAEIHSILPEDAVEDIDFETGKEYFSETMPIVMDSSRVVTRFGKVFYERAGKPLVAKTDHYFKLENEDNILFL